MNLTSKDVQLLSALGKHPLESATFLSREAGMTAPTFTRRLRKLYRDRVLLSISAEVSYTSLGLEPVLYFLPTKLIA